MICTALRESKRISFTTDLHNKFTQNQIDCSLCIWKVCDVCKSKTRGYSQTSSSLPFFVDIDRPIQRSTSGILARSAYAYSFLLSPETQRQLVGVGVSVEIFHPPQITATGSPRMRFSVQRGALQIYVRATRSCINFTNEINHLMFSPYSQIANI